MMVPPVQDISTVVLIAASNRDENHADDGRLFIGHHSCDGTRHAG
jgi:hypothetical protein